MGQERSKSSVCVCVYVCVCVRVCSVISDFVISWTVDHQASLSIGFSRQKYWSGLPFPTPGDLSNPNLCLLCLLPWQLGSLPLVPPGKSSINSSYAPYSGEPYHK